MTRPLLLWLAPVAMLVACATRTVPALAPAGSAASPAAPAGAVPPVTAAIDAVDVGVADPDTAASTHDHHRHHGGAAHGR